MTPLPMDALTGIIAILVFGGGIAWALIEMRGRKVFFTTKDGNALGSKVDLLEKLFHETQAIAVQTTGEVGRLRQEAKDRWESLIAPLQDSAAEVKLLRTDFNAHIVKQTELNTRLIITLEHLDKKINHHEGK